MCDTFVILRRNFACPGGEDCFVTDSARLKAPELAFLDAHALRYDGAVYEGEVKAVTVAALGSPEEEAAAAARNILRLVKEEGYRLSRHCGRGRGF